MGRSIRQTLIAACCWLVPGCTPSTFNCSDDTSCQGLANGQCEPNGFCSTPDDTCDSRRRYGSFAPTSIADQCVASGGETTGTVPFGSSSSSSVSTSLTTNLGTESSSSTTSNSTTSPDTRGTADSSSTGEDHTSTGAAPSPPLFDDDFDRPDSDEVGNGWTEKTPEAFSIVGGGLERTLGDGQYTENLVYRTDLMATDVELEAEFHYLDVMGETSPQLYARLDVAESVDPGTTSGYYLYVSNAEQLSMGRNVSFADLTDIDSEALEPTLTPGVDYRLRFRVTGSNPVELEGFLERREGGEWVESARVEGQDPSRNALGPGSAAVSAGPGLNNFAYDRVAGSPIE